MYQDFYGLRELPFELTPNPKYLFLPPQHREALSTLEYGLSSAKPITVLIGEAGTGKTTLIHAALESERCRGVRCVYVNNPLLTRKEFVETLSLRFGLSAQASASKAVLLDELGRVLEEGRNRGEITALVIDEAQGMSGILLEEIRLLANHETTTRRLLPVVLAGQPELGQRLNEPGLRQLKQRITLRCEVEPFQLRETAAYIGHRVRVAGGDAGRLFTREAVMLIHERAAGIPRTISVLCDNSLLTGFALGRQPIDAAIVREVARDFDLAGPVSESHAFESYASETAPAPDIVTVGPAGLPEVEPDQEPDQEPEPEPVEADTPPVPHATAGHERELFFAFKHRPRFSLFGRRS
jgi:general secretion pathway protein A